jgi:hypothetical protein
MFSTESLVAQITVRSAIAWMKSEKNTYTCRKLKLRYITTLERGTLETGIDFVSA